MTDINELRRLAQAALVAPDGLSAEWMDRLGQFQESVSPAAIIELLDRLEAAESAWKEADKSCHDLTEKVIPNIRTELLDRLEEAEAEALEQARLNGMGSEREAALMAKLEAAERERDALRAELEKIADWNCAWGPYPERNEAWCAMALITAREAVRKEYF